MSAPPRPPLPRERLAIDARKVVHETMDGEVPAVNSESAVLAWPGEETAEQTAPESEEGLWGRSRDFDWGD